MRAAVVAIIVVLGIAISSAVSSDSSEPIKPANLEDQVKSLTAKLEVLERRLADLEKINREQLAVLRAQPLPSAIGQRTDANSRLRLMILQKSLQEQQLQKDAKKRPKFHLLNHTELGVPFDVERAMMGDVGRFQQFVPQERYEFKVEPSTIVIPRQ